MLFYRNMKNCISIADCLNISDEQQREVMINSAKQQQMQNSNHQKKVLLVVEESSSQSQCKADNIQQPKAYLTSNQSQGQFQQLYKKLNPYPNQKSEADSSQIKDFDWDQRKKIDFLNTLILHSNEQDDQDVYSYNKDTKLEQKFLERRRNNQRKSGHKKLKGNRYDPNKDELRKIKNFQEETTQNFIDEQLLKKQETKVINGVKTYFPYQPYDLQVRYMKHVIEAIQSGQNALLQSPTGTGKTLCLLASTLSWLYSQKKEGIHKKVIYLSRTHSQLAQMEKQLKKTCFKPTMCHVGARDHFCVKPQIQDKKGREKMQACSKGVKLKIKDMKGQIKWQKMEPQQAKQTYQAMCNYYKQRQSTIQIGTSYYANSIWEIQDFLKQGQQNKFCPYYYPFHMDQYCDLFLMPYNYILDIDLLPRFKRMLAGSILIFDEAHNVPEASCQGRSYDLYSLNIKGGKVEIHKILRSPKISLSLKEIRNRQRMILKELDKFFENLNETIIGFIKKIPFLDPPSMPDKRYIGDVKTQRIKIFTNEELSFALYQMVMGVVLDEESLRIFEMKGDYYQKQIQKMIHLISNKCSEIDALIQLLKETEDGIFHNMEKISTFWKKVTSLILDSQSLKLNFMEKQINHYRLVLKVDLQPECQGLNGQLLIKDFTIELRCLVPWLTFQDIIAIGPRSIIFTSGTMAPLQSWETELKIEAPIKLINSHVITSQQVRLNILKTNIFGHQFDFRFQALKEKSNQVYQQLVETIFKLSQLVPHGMLVVCPNFKILREIKYVISLYKNKSRMNMVKKQIFEQRGDEKYIDEYKNESQNGAILYCVCRGRASQGIDFPDHHCRAVVFVGIPFPNINDPIIIEKRDHFQKLQKFRKANPQIQSIPLINWDKWYFNGTIRAINQSLGRLIRHSKDYGMLFLLDQRYSQSRFKNAMPMWAQMGLCIWDETTNKRFQNIKTFYEKNANLFNKNKHQPVINYSKGYSSSNSIKEQFDEYKLKKINEFNEAEQKKLLVYQWKPNEQTQKYEKKKIQQEKQQYLQTEKEQKAKKEQKITIRKYNIQHYFKKKLQQKASDK